MDGWMDGWMDGCVDECILCVYIYIYIYIYIIYNIVNQQQEVHFQDISVTVTKMFKTCKMLFARWPWKIWISLQVKNVRRGEMSEMICTLKN